MNQLIKTFKTDQGTIAVDGRALHDFLNVETPYKDWFPRMVDYGFEENVDFVGLAQKSAKPHGGRPQVNHALSLDMAKELSMIQRSEKGRQARRYFIEMEKRALEPKKLSPLEQLKLTRDSVLEIDERVTDLEENQVVSPGEYNWLSKRVAEAVKNYVIAHRLQLTNKQRSKFFRDISNGLNEVTGIKTRSQLRKKDFETACQFIEAWTPSIATLTIINQLGSSITLAKEA